MKPPKYKIYKNPTVKRVIFQINFSNLFLIENRIGAIQTSIMEKFPDASLSIRRDLLFADVGPEFKMEEIPIKESSGRKIWQFRSDNRYTLNVSTNSIDITSSEHKSYYNNEETGEEGFRDIIKYVIDRFLSITNLQIIKRIGLRYMDECPIPYKKDEDSNIILLNEDFQDWYNTSLPLHRFNLKDLGSMRFEANVKRGNYNLIYKEILIMKNNDIKLLLDFDGYKEKISSEVCMDVLDDLHKLIHKEWDETLKDPVKLLMDK
ncbi:MAG: TIGR04255 family protein [Promethearchaeota archaeon]